MRYLLDSQCLFNAAFEPLRLSQTVQAIFRDPGAECHVSTISPYELELKKTLGKLAFPDVADWSALLVRNEYNVLPVAIAHGVIAARLPMHHRDPWDRLLIAQAMAEGLVLIARDRKFADYDVSTVW